MRTSYFEGLDLNLLLTLDALCEERSVTRAAGRIGLSQPAVSRSLARLRRHFDDKLFITVSGGLRPTPRAETLREPLRDALHQLERALASPILELRNWAGPMRMAMLEMDAALMLPALLRSVSLAAPELRLESVPLIDLSLSQLQHSAVDLVIGPISISKGPYLQQKLYTDDFVCIVSSRSIIARQKLSLKTYKSAGHIQIGLMDSDEPTIVDKSLARSKVRRHVVLRLSSLAAAPMILAETDLILTTTRRIAEHFSSLAPLKIFEAPMPITRLDVFQFWHERMQNDVRHKWLRSQIRASVGS